MRGRGLQAASNNMRRNITIETLIALSLCLLLGCQEGNKYTYIEVVQKEVNPGDSVRKYMAGEIIYWPTDSAAYLNAYVKFCTSRRAHNRFDSSGHKLSFRPIDFILINENGVDISKSVNFNNKNSKEREIEKAIRELQLPQ
jgi:hypothetical protein